MFAYLVIKALFFGRDNIIYFCVISPIVYPVASFHPPMLGRFRTRRWLFVGPILPPSGCRCWNRGRDRVRFDNNWGVIGLNSEYKCSESDGDEIQNFKSMEARTPLHTHLGPSPLGWHKHRPSANSQRSMERGTQCGRLLGCWLLLYPLYVKLVMLVIHIVIHISLHKSAR